MEQKERAIVLLAAYDFESLQLSLLTLNHTVNPTEKIIIILNGADCYSASITERIARVWAAQNPSFRFVVKPLSAGKKAYHAITEILAGYEPLKDVQYICKIDDDVIPLKAGWMDNLAKNYNTLDSCGDVGFVTGLINNNCWGFKEIVQLSGNEDVFRKMFNYKTICDTEGCREIEPGEIDSGCCGTIWHYPFLAWWIHQLTSMDIPAYLSMCSSLNNKQIPENIPYSIGCIFFKKQLWLDMDPKLHDTEFDEILLYHSIRSWKLKNWAVMSEPMIHLFYNNQRIANRDIIDEISLSLSRYYGDALFQDIKRMSDTVLEITAHEHINAALKTLTRKIEIVFENIEVNSN